MIENYYMYLLCCWKSKKAFDNNIPLYGHIIYCGYTSNIFQRLVEHITGKGNYNSKRPSYTKQFHGNIKLAYLETFKTRSEAMKRENEFKFPNIVEREVKIKMIKDFRKKHPEILEFVEKNVELLLLN